MSYMEWKPEYNLNIETVDKQHRKLVDIINLLYESTQPDAEKDELHALVEILEKEATAINEMLEYTIKHFKDEEKLMVLNKYPEYEEHKKRHDSFTRQVRQYKEHFDSAEEVDVDEMMRYLKKWLLDHILGEDKKYVPYLKEA